MAMDFFEATQKTNRELNSTERKLFDYVVKNMDEVKKMSIQRFASSQFLSTTTIFRFAQKLGFAGYSEFINCLLITSHDKEKEALLDVTLKQDYQENYLKNAIETVRVISPEQMQEVVGLLKQKPRIYILTDDHTHSVGQYCERLFIGLGFHAYFPETAYQRQNLVNRIRNQDLIIALSYSGDDEVLIDFIQRVFLAEQPYLLSITRADNNLLEGLSNSNFYVFADEINVRGMSLTSSVTMMMIVELLVYEYLAISNLETPTKKG
ncbi:MAG: MurR/RpiR family transcriptional regulator [Turicibacter sp.]|nr:MurR/RpiR family transcriptional regulator [Turicibacter sp.]